jgi:hypothetical protein
VTVAQRGRGAARRAATEDTQDRGEDARATTRHECMSTCRQRQFCSARGAGRAGATSKMLGSRSMVDHRRAGRASSQSRWRRERTTLSAKIFLQQFCAPSVLPFHCAFLLFPWPFSPLFLVPCHRHLGVGTRFAPHVSTRPRRRERPRRHHNTHLIERRVFREPPV